jgi:hypothetical protein
MAIRNGPVRPSCAGRAPAACRLAKVFPRSEWSQSAVHSVDTWYPFSARTLFYNLRLLVRRLKCADTTEMSDAFDEDFAAGLLGKHILVGITYVDAADKPIDRDKSTGAWFARTNRKGSC